ncbi:MAG: hypothetical protein KAI43_10415 [Candidatus Aureabacteria bacterium]|nr:hypothetical protein [Candidatus Auribacterota bacterium]
MKRKITEDIYNDAIKELGSNSWAKIIEVNTEEALIKYREEVRDDIHNSAPLVKILTDGLRFFEDEELSWLKIIDDAEHIQFEIAATDHEEFKKNYIIKSASNNPNKALEITAIDRILDRTLENTMIITKNNIWFQTFHNVRGAAEPPVLKMKRGDYSIQGIDNIFWSDYNSRIYKKPKFKLKFTADGKKYFEEIKSNEKNKEGYEEKEIISPFFISDYKIIIKPGTKRKGVLIINDKIIIEISAIESDLCVVMKKQLKRDWKNIGGRHPVEVGWVSFDEFRNYVSGWEEYENKGNIESEGNVIDDGVIRNAINLLNKKIRKALGIKNNKDDLIENGRRYGKEGHYRFRVYPNLIY